MVPRLCDLARPEAPASPAVPGLGGQGPYWGLGPGLGTWFLQGRGERGWQGPALGQQLLLPPTSSGSPRQGVWDLPCGPQRPTLSRTSSGSHPCPSQRSSSEGLRTGQSHEEAARSARILGSRPARLHRQPGTFSRARAASTPGWAAALPHWGGELAQDGRRLLAAFPGLETGLLYHLGRLESALCCVPAPGLSLKATLWPTLPAESRRPPPRARRARLPTGATSRPLPAGLAILSDPAQAGLALAAAFPPPMSAGSSRA